MVDLDFGDSISSDVDSLKIGFGVFKLLEAWLYVRSLFEPCFVLFFFLVCAFFSTPGLGLAAAVLLRSLFTDA